MEKAKKKQNDGKCMHKTNSICTIFSFSKSKTTVTPHLSGKQN